MQFCVIWLYRLLFLPLLLAMAPLWIFHMCRRGGYCKGFFQRFALIPRLPRLPADRRRMWIHAVSVGEMHSLRPLLNRIFADGRYDVVITSTSSSGLRVARASYGDRATVLAFPLDFWPICRRAWKCIRPDILLHADGELWPEHLRQARLRSIPVFLANARFSERSFRRHRRFRFLSSALWAAVTKIFPDGPASADRLRQLAVGGQKICEIGNLKCDRPPLPPLSDEERAKMLMELGLPPSGYGGATPLLVGCSTWPGEEEFLLTVLDRLRQVNAAWRLLLVPRHGERRDELQRLLRTKQLSYHLRSWGCAGDGSAAVALVDTVGELPQLIRCGSVAFLGKTLPPNGGAQSPVDAISASVPLVSGPAVGNFRDSVEELEQAGAILLGRNAKEVADAICAIAASPERRGRMVEAGLDWLRRKGGAAARICECIGAIAFPSSEKN